MYRNSSSTKTDWNRTEADRSEYNKPEAFHTFAMDFLKLLC